MSVLTFSCLAITSKLVKTSTVWAAWAWSCRLDRSVSETLCVVLPGYHVSAQEQSQFFMNAGSCISGSMQQFLGHQIILCIYG